MASAGLSRPPSVAVEKQRLYTRELMAALAVGALVGIAFAVFQLLPKFAVEQLGAGASALGWIGAVFGIATAVGSLMILWSPVPIERCRLIRIGAVLMTIGSVGFVVVDSVGPLLLALRLLHGIAFALVFTGLMAFVAQAAPPTRLSEALGLVGGSMLAANAVVPAGAELVAARHGWDTVFVGAAIACALGIVFSRRLREQPRASLHRVEREADAPDSLGGAGIALYLTVVTTLGAAFGVMFTFSQPFALEIGRDSVGGFFAAYCMAAIGARLLGGRMSDRLGRYRVSVATLNLYTLVVLATAGLRPAWLEALGALLGIAHGLFFPAFNALVMSTLDPPGRDRLAALFTASFYGGSAASVLLLGHVAAYAGYPVIFVITACATFVAGSLLVLSPSLGDDASRVAAKPALFGESRTRVSAETGACSMDSMDETRYTVGRRRGRLH